MERENIGRIKVGLYGSNGHQIQKILTGNPLAELYAVADFPQNLIPQGTNPIIYSTLDELIADKNIELVSLCSSRRRDQADHAIRCMEAGKNVYAEKPCAMTEKDLDNLIETSRRTGMAFHEMAGTAFEQPYLAMRKIVQEGKIGTVVQVFAQKSYPYFDARPQDEDIDGGLFLQVGIHAVRFIEHLTGIKIIKITAVQTRLGNPKSGDLHMAASLIASLENGAVASSVINYLNPKAFPTWGNEEVRIFGLKGFVEATDGGTRTRLVLNEKDCGSLDMEKKETLDYLDLFLKSLSGIGKMPLLLEEELNPLRMLIRARKNIED